MKRLLTIAAAASLVSATASHAQTVQVFAAGSLRGVVGDLAKQARPDLGVEIMGEFGGSGRMRERIEKGEKAEKSEKKPKTKAA